MRWLTTVALAGIIGGLPYRAAAQVFTSLDANVASVTYDAYLPSAVYTLAPSASFAGGPIRAGADGALSMFQTGHLSSAVGVNALGGTKIYGPLRWDAGVEGNALWYRSNPPVLSFDVAPRLHSDLGAFAAWAGGAFGSSDNDSLHGSFVHRFDAGASYALPHVTPAFTVSTAQAGIAHYTDVVGSLQGQWSQLNLVVAGGHRTGVLLGGAASWLNAELRVTVMDGVALVVAGGSYPTDLVRGSPGAHFFGGGIRLSEMFRVRRRATGTVRYTNGSNDVMADPRTLRFGARANARVELMADFTGWQPVLMIEIRPGRYQVTLPDAIRSGPHRVNIRVDNGDWDVPSELPPVVDDFGGTAGSLVVP